MYQLLPTLLEHAEEHVRSTGNAQKVYCDAASAAICASCLLNAPAQFVDILLYKAWHEADLFKPGSSPKAVFEYPNTSEQRKEIVNTPLPEHLISVLLNFIFLEVHKSSLPPLLVRTHDSSGAAIAPSAPVDNGRDALSRATTGQSGFPVTREVCRQISPVAVIVTGAIAPASVKIHYDLSHCVCLIVVTFQLLNQDTFAFSWAYGGLYCVFKQCDVCMCNLAYVIKAFQH